jgi:hypothetical protein
MVCFFLILNIIGILNCSFPETWKVLIKTGKYTKGSKDKESEERNNGVPPAPPTANLVMVIYGDDGKTNELPLLAKTAPRFKENTSDEFEVRKQLLSLFWNLHPLFRLKYQEISNWGKSTKSGSATQIRLQKTRTGV